MEGGGQGCVLGSTWLLLKLDCFPFSSPQRWFSRLSHDSQSQPAYGRVRKLVRSQSWSIDFFFFLKTQRWKISICLKMTTLWCSKGILSKRVCSKEWMCTTLIHLSLYSSIHPSIHSFIQYIVTVYPLCARCCSNCWGFHSEQNRQVPALVEPSA